MRRLVWVLALVTVLGLARVVHADVEDFVINDFRGRYELFNDTNGGRMLARETIQLTYSDYNHGILRAIPIEYRGNSLRLKILSVERDGDEEPYTTYGENDNEVLKIGDPDKTITGPHTYEISYEMRNIVTFYDNHDEWYWDINGDQWRQPFEHVSGEVIFPNGWKGDDVPAPQCFTGTYGDTRQGCVVEKTERGYAFSTTAPLNPSETLTIVAGATKGLFSPRTAADWWRDNAGQLSGIAAGIGGSVCAYLVWRRHGKDHKGRGVIIPEYAPPKNLSPAEVGLLMDYNVDGRDLTATIIDLAVRGYLRIHDDEKKRLGLFKKHEFSLELVKADTAGLKPHESKLLKALFDPFSKGTLQAIAAIDRKKMYAAVEDVKKKLNQELTDSYGLFEKDPKKYQGWLCGIGVAALIVVFFVNPGWGWTIGLVILAGACFGFASVMRRRSHAGVEALEKLQGLKLYMNIAEKDRLKMLQSVERPYAEPSRTPKLFEKLLPFAVALGVEKSWAKQFEGIYTQPPGWYAGNYATFNMVYFAGSLSGATSAMNTSFAPPSSSSGSGMGGGGFSGGGGGGGGGGGW